MWLTGDSEAHKGWQMEALGGSCWVVGAWTVGWEAVSLQIMTRTGEETRSLNRTGKITDLGLYPSIGQVASYSSILAMGTVLGCDVLVGALPEGGFLSRASNFT